MPTTSAVFDSLTLFAGPDPGRGTGVDRQDLVDRRPATEGYLMEMLLDVSAL